MFHVQAQPEEVLALQHIYRAKVHEALASVRKRFAAKGLVFPSLSDVDLNNAIVLDTPLLLSPSAVSASTASSTLTTKACPLVTSIFRADIPPFCCVSRPLTPRNHYDAPLQTATGQYCYLAIWYVVFQANVLAIIQPLCEMCDELTGVIAGHRKHEAHKIYVMVAQRLDRKRRRDGLNHVSFAPRLAARVALARRRRASNASRESDAFDKPDGLGESDGLDKYDGLGESDGLDKLDEVSVSDGLGVWDALGELIEFPS
jgi:hypothetical protein